MSDELLLLRLDPASVVAQPEVLSVQQQLNSARPIVSLDIVSVLSEVPQPVNPPPVISRVAEFETMVPDLFQLFDAGYYVQGGIPLIASGW